MCYCVSLRVYVCMVLNLDFEGLCKMFRMVVYGYIIVRMNLKPLDNLFNSTILKFLTLVSWFSDLYTFYYKTCFYFS